MKHIAEFLDEALRDMFEERAAIIEFDAGETRSDAERRDMAEVDAWRKAREVAQKDSEVNK